MAEFQRRPLVKKILQSTVFAILVCALPILLRVCCGESPSTHPEGNCFIIHYNSAANPVKLIFDPLRTDWASFQARELSYLLDYLDAKFIFASIRSHHAHFYSLSALLLLIASAGLIHSKLKKLYPQSPALLQLLVPLMYVCSFVNFTGFFRSSKPAVSFLLLWIFFNIAAMVKFPEKFQSFRAHWWTAILLLLMPGFDRIGFFSAAACAGGSALVLGMLSCELLPIERTKVEALKKPLMIFSVSALVSVIFSLIYNFAIAPALVEAINGYKVSFEYQTFRMPITALHKGAVFILQNYGGFFLPVNGMAALFCGAAVVLFLTFCAIRCYRQNPENILVIIAFCGIFTASLLCAGMMNGRHPLINELPIGSYFQVFGAALTGISAVVLFELKEKKSIIILTVLMIFAGMTPVCRMILPKPYCSAELVFHQQTTGETIGMLNSPEKTPSKLLPTTSWELIAFARKSGGILK